MLNILLANPALPTTGGTSGGGASPLGSNATGLILMIGLFVVLYFVLFLPQKKKDKAMKKMRQELKAGDRVTTIGGIFGRVSAVKDDVITLEVGQDKVKIMVARWAIGTVNGAGDGNSSEKLETVDKA